MDEWINYQGTDGGYASGDSSVADSIFGIIGNLGTSAVNRINAPVTTVQIPAIYPTTQPYVANAGGSNQLLLLLLLGGAAFLAFKAIK